MYEEELDTNDEDFNLEALRKIIKKLKKKKASGSDEIAPAI